MNHLKTFENFDMNRLEKLIKKYKKQYFQGKTDIPEFHKGNLKFLEDELKKIKKLEEIDKISKKSQ